MSSLVFQFLLVAVILAVAAAQFNATTCVCTTVPCPVPGNNYLSEGNRRLLVRYSGGNFI